jgi:hypothetical protein
MSGTQLRIDVFAVQPGNQVLRHRRCIRSIQPRPRRQMRSPAQALGNGDRQIRHFLIFCSVDRSGFDFSCRPPTAGPRSSDALLDSGKGFALSLRLLTL